MIQRFFLGIVVCAALSYGQASSNSVTVTASRNPANLQPDQVVFSVGVTSGVTATRDEIVAALQGAGITVANFVGVNTSQVQLAGNREPQQVVQWSFSLPVALSDMKSTIGLLSAVQKNIAQKNNGLSMSFAVQGTAVSQQLAQSQTCAVADLLADARAQGQKLASAAGSTLGAVLALSGATTASPVALGNPFASPVSFPVCSLTVKFALGAF